MSLFNSKRVENIANKTSEMTFKTPSEMLKEVLKKASGSKYGHTNKYNMFYNIYGFIGALEGYGSSTLCANVAYALSKTGMPICVIDTSMLHPQQDILLNTTAVTKSDIPMKDKVDWFDMPYQSENKSVLHVSGYASNISVLSFYGKERSITDMLSTKDSDTLAEMAIAQLKSKFDVILIDFSHEPTAVNAGMLHRVQKIYQIWNDAPQFTDNIAAFMRNMGVLSVPYDKMVSVVYSMLSSKTIGTLDSLLAKYKFNKITETYFSDEIKMVSCLRDRILFQHESKDPEVIQFTKAICDIVADILNFEEDDLGKTSVKSKDIEAGKIEGTATKMMKDKEKADYRPDIITDLENADKSLEKFMFDDSDNKKGVFEEDTEIDMSSMSSDNKKGESK